MSRGKQLSIQRRNDIVQDYLSGLSRTNIAQKYFLSITTISRTISRFQNTKSNEDKLRCGRPKKISSHSDSFILREIKKNTGISANQIVQNLNNVHGYSISPSTVRRRLYERGFHGRRPRKVPGLSKNNIRKRHVFAKSNENRPMTYWNSIIWSDEAKFDTRNDNSHRFKWRQPGMQLKKENLSYSFKSGNVSQMVWGCFIGNQLGPLHFIDGIMDRFMYVRILEDKMLPFYNE